MPKTKERPRFMTLAFPTRKEMELGINDKKYRPWVVVGMTHAEGEKKPWVVLFENFRVQNYREDHPIFHF